MGLTTYIGLVKHYLHHLHYFYNKCTIFVTLTSVLIELKKKFLLVKNNWVALKKNKPFVKHHHTTLVPYRLWLIQF